MTNLEAIKEDYKIGDPIRITCRLGVKVGYIMDISESRIKLRPFEEGLKPISISDESISDFEEYNPKQNIKADPPKTLTSKNPFKSALREQPIAYVSASNKDRIEMYKLVEDNQNVVKAVGFIKAIKNNHGWIWDQDLREDVFFSSFDICDDCLKNEKNLIGLHVVYSKAITNSKKGSDSKQLYPKAVGICLPHPIYELLAMAHKLQENVRTQQQAFDILEDVLEQYPDNEEAKLLSKSLIVNVKTRIKHSFGTVLNIENIRELASTYHNKEKSISLKKTRENSLSIIKSKAPRKPLIVTDKATLEALPLKKKQLSESECRDIEKELDGLIRNGEREQCLKRSYEVLANSCPTPKYLRSYLDRMVNTEIALGNNEAAMNCLAQLIAYNEKLNDTKPNTISHLYLTLARVMIKLSLLEEALHALDCAEWMKPGNRVVQNMRNQILESKNNNTEGVDNSNKKESTEDDLIIKSSSVSKLLLQDIDERLRLSDSLEFQDPLAIYKRAVKSISDEKETYYSRAQYFLESAVAYKLSNQLDSKEYWLSIANYASMRGNAMFNRVSELLHNYPETQDELVASCDSAKSYFVEALGIYNDLSEKHYLQDHFLKYLKLENMISMIEGGKTPDIEWNSGNLKEMLRNCLQKDNSEAQKVLYKVCIIIGSTAPGAWFTLAADKDGTGPMTGKFVNDEFRKSAFNLFNEIEQADIDVNLKYYNFLSSIFKHRRLRLRQFDKFLNECLEWKFSQHDIAEFADKWKQISEFEDLLLPTDKRACNDINSVVKILEPYANLGDKERGNLLNTSQQTLRNCIKIISETTTYYGGTFFYHLAQNWLTEIDKQIANRIATTYPKLMVNADSCFIKEKSGKKYINYIVSNYGESTATSFIVKIETAANSSEVFSDEALPAGDFRALSWDLPTEMYSMKVFDVKFEVIPKYQGRDLPSSTYGITFEEDNGNPIDIKDIPWNINETPAKHIFKGREGLLNDLLKHYLSIERATTIILYGLTRTGKTSILKYLRDKISGKPLDDKPSMKVLPISWDLKAVAYKKGQEADFWENLVGTNMYETFSKEIKTEIANSYKSGCIPDDLSQNDFIKIVDVLNNIGYFPFITIDEFSYVKNSMDEGLLNASFLSILRDMSLNGKAAFVYAGTYDIKELPRDPKYGITGQLVNTKVLPVIEIDNDAANELIDAWVPTLNFTDDAKLHIRRLSGCVPYWIQWICRSCGKYVAKLDNKKHWLGYFDVEEVVKLMIGEKDSESFASNIIDENNFQNNQYTPDAIAEHAVITCISYINREVERNARGVGIPELQNLWKKYNVTNDFIRQMVNAITKLEEKRIITSYTDESREVYRLNVDLFRRWWYVHHKDLNLVLTH